MGEIQQLLITIPIFILSISFHEAAHAYTAFYLGDDTAQKQGRLTLNPLAHLDPLGTLMLLVVHFGWAKPVPVDSRNLKKPDLYMSIIAAAGPLSNLLIAIFCIIGMNLLKYQPPLYPIISTLQIGAWLNIMLFVFNLIPFPPLDGGNIMRGFLPSQIKETYDQLAPYGMLILLALLFLPFTKNILIGSVSFIVNWLQFVAFGWL